MAADRPGEPVVHQQPASARDWVRQLSGKQQRVALVPTMGALHEGHLQLVRRARQLADHVVVSIFVNPTQFGPQEDFTRYPRTFPEDLRLLSQEGVAMVFAPTAQEMYGRRFSTFVDPPAVAQPLEGQLRPGHFRGVCTVVLKLFNIIPADVAIFGQKDYQQARVIAEMILDLNLDITLDLAPTVRTPDGLAMSSRNRYLTPADQPRALALSRALQQAADQYAQGQREAPRLEAVVRQVLQDAGVDSIDYAAVVDPLTLLPFDGPIPDQSSAQLGELPGDLSPVAVVLIAAHVARTRLIDNRLLYPIPSSR